MTAHKRKMSPPVVPSSADGISSWLDVMTSMLALPETQRQAVRDELEDHLRSRVDDLLITSTEEHIAIQQAITELGETANFARVVTQAHTHVQTRRRIMQGILITAAVAGLSLGGYSMLTAPNAYSSNSIAETQSGVAAPIEITSPEEKHTESLRNPTRVYAMHWADKPLLATIARTIESSLVRMDFEESAMVEIVGQSFVINTNAEAFPVIEEMISALQNADAESKEMELAERTEKLERVRVDFTRIREQLLEAHSDAIHVKREHELREIEEVSANDPFEITKISERLISLEQQAKELDLRINELQARYAYLNETLIDLEYEDLMAR